METNNYKRGFVKEILIVIVTIVVLSYLGVNIRDILDSEAVRGNFLAVWDFLAWIWNNYILPVFTYLFDLAFSLANRLR